MKDMRSLLLVLLSFGLVATWIYHLYDKAHYSQEKTAAVFLDNRQAVRDTILRDSLQKAYSKIDSLDFKLDSVSHLGNLDMVISDSLQSQLDDKISEVNRLKAEVSKILKNPGSTSSELALARQKINEMEEIIRQLQNDKSVLEAEKQQLTAKLEQMGGQVNDLQQNMKRLDTENKGLSDKIRSSSVFSASALHFTAMNVRETREQETSQAKKADRFIASFVLQNNFNEYLNAEIIIAIVQPDGHVLQNSTWDSGTFDTKTEGKKSFTRKIKFDYSKGEQKTLIFSLDIESMPKGTYVLQVWHDGLKIGETTKVLN
jgi:predicted  nucleic acid-binding Zn-ribbon protein